MRSALLFAIRLLAPAMVFAYVFAFLGTPCMPLADPSGQAQAIPRWEYWLLHVSVPNAIWWQWSGGNLPVMMSDRLPILMAATIWVGCCLLVGSLISRWDPVRSRLSKYERIGVAILVGHAALVSIVFLIGSLIGVKSLVWLLVALMGVVSFYTRYRSALVDPVSAAVLVDDSSFASSVSRRMIGLLILATFFLASVQVYGATIPTRDMQVREVDWWLVKHTARDGKIRFSDHHAFANAPAGFAMPSVAFSSAFMLDLPFITDAIGGSLEQRERWQQRLYLSVLAGKTIEALMALVGVLLASVHLGRRFGYLSGLFMGFLLIATPGLSELTRLGRTEGLIGVWAVGLLVVWHATRASDQPKTCLGLLWGLFVAGALSSGYGAAVLVGLPACFLWIWKRTFWLNRAKVIADDGQSQDGFGSGIAPVFGKNFVSNKMVAFLVLFAACGFYVRNGIASGDPIYPWGRVAVEKLGLLPSTEMSSGLAYAHQVPSETVFELLAVAEADTTTVRAVEIKSPYRLANVLDGLFRLIWSSSGHGLLLVPLAMVGVLGSRNFLQCRMAVGWFSYWVLVWWLFSLRQDRDWMGALCLLAWPAAAGTRWLVARARGYPMMVLVSIAIGWSVVVLPIWPMSDNRMLVGLKTLEQHGAAVGTEPLPDSENSVAPTYASSFNTYYRESGVERLEGKLLLIGESDDFDLLADCVSDGPFDKQHVDVTQSTPAFAEFLRLEDISHVMIVWSGVQYREKWIGRRVESEYRELLSEMLSDSRLRPIPWEINSSQAELYQVIKE